MKILGLDISTSYTGIIIIDDSLNILHMNHIDYSKCKTFWDKVDLSKQKIDDIKIDVDKIFIEDPAKKFSMGASSANTIVTLARFNGLVSYFSKVRFNIDPIYIAPGAARKLCGLKMLQRNKDPLQRTHKEQTFDHIMGTDLSNITWPTKKNSTKLVDYAYDIVDAYVIAKAGLSYKEEDGGKKKKK